MKPEQKIKELQALLKLSGKLAITATQVLFYSNVLNLSRHLELMKDALDEYDRAMIENTNKEATHEQ